MTARSSTIRISEHEEQHDRRRSTRLSRAAAWSQVVLLAPSRRRPARVAAGVAWRPRGARGIEIEAGGRAVLRERHREHRAGRAVRAPGADLGDARRARRAASRTGASYRAPSGTTTSVGAFAPAGKLSAISFWPSADSTVVAELAVAAVSVVRRAAVSPRQRDDEHGIVPTQTARGPRPDPLAIRRQMPCVSSVALAPTRGTNGQNARRRRSSSSAGGASASRASRSPRPSAPIGPSAAGAADLGQRQRQQRRDHRPARGEDRRPARVRAPCASPRACPRGGAVPRGSARRAAARSRCRRRRRAPAGSRPSAPVTVTPALGEQVARRRARPPRRGTPRRTGSARRSASGR